MLSLFLLHAAGSGTTSYASETVRDAVRANSVVIFSQSQCPLSEKTKAYFEDLGVPYYALELDTRADGSAVKQALAQLTGAKSVPRVFVNGQVSVGGAFSNCTERSLSPCRSLWTARRRINGDGSRILNWRARALGLERARRSLRRATLPPRLHWSSMRQCDLLLF
mmetsp:Transcript_32926/g.96981  ORF Transcript_32926/g.96981 Transcript_32926/m.96981 type:complete len:166 (+) Transcript_32926:52-549(+)